MPLHASLQAEINIRQSSVRSTSHTCRCVFRQQQKLELNDCFRVEILAQLHERSSDMSNALQSA